MVTDKVTRSLIGYRLSNEIIDWLQFAKTLVSSSSLSLLPISTMPVFWMYDHAMSLYPLPNVVVAADSYYPYTKEYSGCTVVNPVSELCSLH